MGKAKKQAGDELGRLRKKEEDMLREARVRTLENAFGLYTRENRPHFDSMKTVRNAVNEHADAVRANLYAAYVLARKNPDDKDAVLEMIKLADDSRAALAALTKDFAQRVGMVGWSIKRAKSSWEDDSLAVESFPSIMPGRENPAAPKTGKSGRKPV